MSVRSYRRAIALIGALLALMVPSAAAPQAVHSTPMAVSVSDPVPPPRDEPYPGTLTLDVDASDMVRAIFRANETIPVAPGTQRLTLLYPEWRPGNHSRTGRIAQLSELRFTANGKVLAWRREPAEPFAFTVELPTGATAVTAELIYAGALQASEGQVLATPTIADVQWDRLSLYPAGHYVRRIRIRPSVTLPAGWGAASALDGETVAGAARTFAETDYETLADSPLYAGANFRRFDLGGDVRLDLFADDAKDLAASPAALAAHRKLVREAAVLFGGRHFDHYDMLVALSSGFYSIGTEHQRSAEMQLSPNTFRQPEANGQPLREIAHELVHSWNGKFKRPARLWTPDFRQPMQTDLLWVYEGLTQFWGYVLGARSGVQDKDMVLGEIAASTANYAEMPGRGWRSVEDTTADPVVAYHDAKVWPSLARASDYYREAALVWLEADQIIRQRTAGKRGLDDFARVFFGRNDLGQTTYEREDVVAALTAIAPYDWRGFFAARIDSPGQPAPLAGIEAAGYRLVYRDTPNPYDRASMSEGGLSLAYSLGVTLDRAGKITSVRWHSPAFAAGLVGGMTVLAIDGQAYSGDALRAAVIAAKDRREPTRLLIKRGDAVSAVDVDYHAGLRYPWLEPKGPGEQPLDRLLAPHTVARLIDNPSRPGDRAARVDR